MTSAADDEGLVPAFRLSVPPRGVPASIAARALPEEIENE